MTDADTAQLVFALALLLMAAHGLGWVASRLRQPRVAGEIIGGLLLGPTLFGLLLPDWQEAIFAGGGPTEVGLDIAYELGLILLMFCSGAEVRSIVARGERRPVAALAVIGSVLPFVGGLVAVNAWDGADRLLGPAADRTAFALIFALAMAVTSIPVISRIMSDLGLLGTRFARIVLSVAVLEDLVVYVVLNIALARVVLSESRFGLPSLLDIAPATALGQTYYVVCTLAFFTLPLLLGPEFVGRLARMRGNAVRRGSAVGFQLVVLLVLTGCAALIGVAPIFGALVAGILTADLHPPDDGARRTIHSFSYAFFIPLYFALVGLRLDLVHDFQPLFFLGFLALACLVKALSCYLGARLAGENPPDARNLAVALNARGGPGIVLASVAFDAEIIDAGFYTSLVMLAIVTSLVAGSLLQRALARGTLSPGSGTDRPSRSSP